MDTIITDHVAEFRRAMTEHGLVVRDEVIADGEIHRCDTNQRNGRGDGAYVLHVAGQIVVGGFENHQAGTGWVTWKPERQPIISAENKRKMEQSLAAMRAKRDADADLRRKKAAEQASKMWSEARPADHNHPYLARKGVKAHDIRVGTWKGVDNTLLIPVTDGENFLSMQFIFPEKHAELGRDKDFLPGGKKAGGFFPIGEIHDRVVLCEGYATGATIHEASGLPVVIAFDATNMAAVALNIRAAFPLTEIIVAADNDHKTAGNPGLQAADKVLQSVGNARICEPSFNPGDSGTDWNDYAQQHGVGAVREVFCEPSPLPFPALSLDDVLGKPPIKWLVKDVVPTTGIGACYGPSGSGKSFLILDLLAAITNGGGDATWFGSRIKAARPVVYVALEGEHGIAQRVQAYVKEKGRPGADFRFMFTPMNLMTGSDVDDLIASIRALGMANPVICLDTLNQATPGMDENTSKDMGLAIAAIKRIQAELDAVVLVVHHTGKDSDKGLRGHSSLGAAMDFVLAVRREPTGQRAWSTGKQKDAADDAEFFFTLKVVELGEDDDGDAITSCVVVQDIGNGGLEAVVATSQDKKTSVSVKDALKEIINGITKERELAAQLMIGKSTIGKMLARLKSAGYLDDDGQPTEKAISQMSTTGMNLKRNTTPVWKRKDD